MRSALSEAADSADWLADEASNRYEKLDAIDLDTACVERVFVLYQTTYRKFGEPYLKSPAALLKYNRWVLFYKGSDRSPQNIVACALFDVTSYGLKGRFRASDLSPEGRAAVKAFSIASYNAQGVFSEISGPLEAAIVDKVHVVPFEIAKRILEKLGHDVVDAGRDRYVRSIHGQQEKKVMVGYPYVPDDD